MNDYRCHGPEHLAKFTGHVVTKDRRHGLHSGIGYL